MIAKGPEQPISSVLAPDGPQRALIIASFVSRVGNGLFNTAAVLYFTLVVHLPAAQVGVGLTIAGLTGLLAGTPRGTSVWLDWSDDSGFPPPSHHQCGYWTVDGSQGPNDRWTWAIRNSTTPPSGPAARRRDRPSSAPAGSRPHR